MPSLELIVPDFIHTTDTRTVSNFGAEVVVSTGYKTATVTTPNTVPKYSTPYQNWYQAASAIDWASQWFLTKKIPNRAFIGLTTIREVLWAESHSILYKSCQPVKSKIITVGVLVRSSHQGKNVNTGAQRITDYKTFPWLQKWGIHAHTRWMSN